jgi:hypothetical protein
MVAVRIARAACDEPDRERDRRGQRDHHAGPHRVGAPAPGLGPRRIARRREPAEPRRRRVVAAAGDLGQRAQLDVQRRAMLVGLAPRGLILHREHADRLAALARRDLARRPRLDGREPHALARLVTLE